MKSLLKHLGPYSAGTVFRLDLNDYFNYKIKYVIEETETTVKCALEVAHGSDPSFHTMYDSSNSNEFNISKYRMTLLAPTEK